MMQIQVSNIFLNFSDDFVVKTDIKRLQQVLLNLLSNSIKFTAKQGSIVIMVEKQEQEGMNDKLRISVTDNGQGIKKKNQCKLFKMFGTIKDTKRGLNTNGIGLGLVISKQIVERFNGIINYYSKYKRGTTFFYTFEINKVTQSNFLEYQQMQQLESKPSIPKAIESNCAEHEFYKQLQKLIHFKKERVLVVDDEEFCLASMKAIIQKTGFDVANRLDVCINGIEMVNLVCNSWAIGINYKLIFTDFSMPSMDGIEAVDLIRQFFRESNVPLESQPHIIGVTGHVHNDYTKLGLQAGMN
jgi:CheY-like chemotaxis protein/anti-sigma regulatory factor (Ser/Thr protein kinase)